ncbi:MAG: DUF4347 domain-containing protein [Acidobacteriota bacterium]
MGGKPNGALSTGKFDAIHIISHGKQNFIQFGKENISTENFDLFLKWTDLVRNIVIWACEVGRGVVPGAEENYSSIAPAIAGAAKARLLLAETVRQAGRLAPMAGSTDDSDSYRSSLRERRTSSTKTADIQWYSPILAPITLR